MVNLQCQLDLIWNHHRNTYPDVNSVFLERLIGERKIYVGCGLCRCMGWERERSLSTTVHLPATRLLLTLLPLESVPLTCAPQSTLPSLQREKGLIPVLAGPIVTMSPWRVKAYDSVSSLGPELPVYPEDMGSHSQGMRTALMPSLWGNSDPYRD